MKGFSFSSTDLLFLILFLSWIDSINFSQIRFIQIVGLVAVGIWAVLIVIKLIQGNKHETKL